MPKPPCPLPEGIKLVSWDVDGTLYPLPLLKLRFTWALALKVRAKGWKWSWETLQGMQGLHEWLDGQRARNAGQVDRGEWEARREIFEREKALFAEVLPLLPLRGRVLPLLEYFRQTGATQVSLSDLECEYKLRALRVERFFAGSFHSEGIGHWKPSPVPFRLLQERFGVRPEEHLHVGDRPETDGAGAKAGGCHFLLL